MTGNGTAPGDVSIVLIGLMGAGKSSVGRRLAKRLHLRFVDADEEIVQAAGCSIPDIFELYGEQAFRDVERRVIARLLNDGGSVMATGGGAFMDPETRARISAKAVSVWLRADLDVLVDRTSRRDTRPLLRRGNPRDVLECLIRQRHPVYEQANVIVDSCKESVDATVRRVIHALVDAGHLACGATESP